MIHEKELRFFVVWLTTSDAWLLIRNRPKAAPSCSNRHSGQLVLKSQVLRRSDKWQQVLKLHLQIHK